VSARNPNELSLQTYRRARALLISSVAVLLLWNLWGYDVWAPDEPYLAEGAREMLVDGQWLVPHINGELDNHKPPLFFWLIAVLSLPFGEVSAFTARLPSVLVALVSVLLTMRLASKVGGRRVALLAGAVLPLSYLFYDKARTSQIDSLLCA
jgi:4-amino-4-deoxy-L-arabinose transferase-like glycosyltransferase